MTSINVNAGKMSSFPAPAESPFAPGQTVHVSEGALQGLEAVIVERRSSDRYLLQLHHGVYVEMNVGQLV